MVTTLVAQPTTWKRLRNALDGVLFSVFLIIAFGLVFNAVQSNSIADAMYTAFNWNKTIVGGVLVVLSGFVIFGGIRKIARTAEVLVPIMAIFYLLLAVIVIAMNLEKFLVL